MKGLRGRLAEATQAAHERMHRHDGFAAAAAGQLDAGAYRDLLARLYGFYRPFEADFDLAPPDLAQAIGLRERARTPALAADLRALGGGLDVETLPKCVGLPERSSEPQWLGSLYVTEGSTLGGAEIAAALDRAGFARAQRGYFESYGARRGLMWRHFLARLEIHAQDPEAVAQAAAAAEAHFDAFETWMRDWRGAAEAP